METKINRNISGIFLNVMHDYTVVHGIFTLSGFYPQSPEVQLHTVCSLVWLQVNMPMLAILNRVTPKASGHYF
jgi:hypothetical protein